jgi:hypothetical protein
MVTKATVVVCSSKGVTCSPSLTDMPELCGQTRGLNEQDGADATFAGGRQPLLEARSGDPATEAIKIVECHSDRAGTPRSTGPY